MIIVRYLLVVVLLTADLFTGLYASGLLPLPSLGVFLFTLMAGAYCVTTARVSLNINKGVFIAFIFVSLGLFLSAVSPNYNLVKILHLLLYPIFIYCIYCVYRNKQAQLYKLINLLVFATSCLAIIYIIITVLANLNFILDINYLVKSYPEYGVIRMTVLFNEPLLMGFYFLLVLALANYLERTVVYNVILIVAIMFTFSLSAYLLLFVYLLVKYVRINIASFRFYLSLILITGLFVGLLVIFQDRVLKILMFEDGSTRIRMALTISAFMMFLDNWIVGVGWGNSSELFSNYANLFSSSVHMDVQYSSNLYLSILCELGVVGILPFGYFMYYLTKRSTLNRGLFSGCITILISFFQQSLLLTPLLWFFWIVLLLNNRSSQN